MHEQDETKVSRNNWKLDKQVAAEKVQLGSFQVQLPLENSARFPWIAQAAKIDLATPASEAICERLYKRVNPAKHIGTTDRMARMLDESFEMFVITKYNIARHEGVEAIEVSMHSELF